MFPSSELDKLMLRMPDGMRPQLKAMAALNRRSLNSEVIFHLERVLRNANAATGANLPGATPAAASDSAALQGGSIHTNR